MSALVFKDFKCYYKNKKQYTQVLFDINFEVKEGEFLVVVGESGSGKTTLIKACLGIADAFEGDLYMPMLKDIGFKYVYHLYDGEFRREVI